MQKNPALSNFSFIILKSIARLPFNPLASNTPFLYPLETSENLQGFCFQGVEKGCIGNEWVKSDE